MLVNKKTHVWFIFFDTNRKIPSTLVTLVFAAKQTNYRSKYDLRLFKFLYLVNPKDPWCKIAQILKNDLLLL